MTTTVLGFSYLFERIHFVLITSFIQQVGEISDEKI